MRLEFSYPTHSLDELAVEVFDAVSLIYYQKLPVPVTQEFLVLHADLVRCHYHRLKLLRFPLSLPNKHLPSQPFPLWNRPMIEDHWDLHKRESALIQPIRRPHFVSESPKNCMLFLSRMHR